MAEKKEKSELQKAKDELAKAQIKYGLTVRKRLPGNATNEERLEHQKNCQAALEEKRKAAAAVEDILMGRVKKET